MSKNLPKFEMHYTCPRCGLDWHSSLQTMDVELVKGNLKMQLGFECWQCNSSWWQDVLFEIGKVLENKITVS